jgi:hypothetical protein
MTKVDWFRQQYGIFLGGLSQFVQPLVTLGSPLQTLTPSLLPHVPPPNPTRAAQGSQNCGKPVGHHGIWPNRAGSVTKTDR